MKKYTLTDKIKQYGSESSNALKGGSYSLILTAIVFSILVVINIFANTLPASMTKLDISAAKLYSITSNTKVVVNALEKDVTIYWVVQSGEEDDIIENLLSKYDSLSDHIEVIKKNPDVYPTFTKQYTSSSVPNNSLIVESGEKYRYISIDEIYELEFDYYSYTYVTSGFDGEGVITSAIDYVVSDEFPKIYLLEGHGESELPSTFSEQLDKENVETKQLSLLTVEAVPEDADIVMIYSPASDISSNEKALLADYVDNGGKLLVMAGPAEDNNRENLNSLATDYGVQFNDGIVIEEDSYYYAFQRPYILLPDIASHDVTDSLIQENYYAIMPLSQGMTVTSTNDGTVTELLTTSYYSFSKSAGYDLTTYEREDNDTDGPFALAVSIEDYDGGCILWFSSSEFLTDMYNSYSSGANGDMAMNAVSFLIGDSEAMTIRSKSLYYNYLTISESTSSLLKLLMIGVFPLMYLGTGICVIMKKRSMGNE